MSVPAAVHSATRPDARPSTGPAELDLARPFDQILGLAVRRLWMQDRELAELRWGAITVAAMAVLGFLAGLLHASDDFSRVRLIATPAAVILAAAAWSPYASRLAASSMVRLALGPAVIAIAVVGAGLGDIATLQLPPAAPMVVLGLAFAAITPGYAIGASLILGAAILVFLAHAFGTLAPDVSVQATDRFVVNVAVALVASAGMAIVVRVATEAEARANRLARQNRERLDVLERVNDMVGQFDGSRPVRSVVQGVVEAVARDFDIALVSMYLPDADGRLEMVGVAGYQAPFHIIEPGVGVVGRAALTREIQFVPDVLADPDYRAARADVRSEVAVPVVHSDELLSIVNFEGTALHPIGPSQVALAEMLAHSLGGALRSARFDDDRRERLRAIERVMAVSRALVADLDRPRIVAAIIDAAVELLGVDVAALFSRAADGVFRLEAGTGVPGEALGTELPTAIGLSRRAIAERRPVTGAGEAALWPRDLLAERPGGGTAHAALALPIVVDDRVTAVLTVSRIGVDRSFSELERGIADLLVAQVEIGLQNADLHARVADSALRDPLTGLLNRRFFDEAIETAYATARRSNDPLGLLVLDLDHFSAVNNEHGHSVGDAVLRRVARSIRNAVRDGDVVVRYGGEEFVVIAPSTDADGAVAIAERIRVAVALSGREPIEGRLVPVTISAGVACLVDESDGHGLFRAADSALLAAKRAGRNRVVTI